MKKALIILFSVLYIHFVLNAQDYDKSHVYKLTHHMSYEEWLHRGEIGKNFTPTDPPNAPVRMLAEFEQMKGVIIAFDTFENAFGIPVNAIKEMAEDVTVTVIAEGSTAQTTVTNLFNSNGVNMDNVEFLSAPTDSWWVRDYGPWFVIDGNDEFGVCDFPYNRPFRVNDDEIPVEVSSFMNTNLFGMNLIATGGNYMCDGLGIAASTDLIWEENPSLSHDEVAQLVNDYLGVHTYHVLADPLGDYIKHIDCWGKFLDVDKILLGQVPENDPRYQDFENIAEYFSGQTSSYGTPYEIYRVFTPGNNETTPYTNSLILNNKVFVPISGSQYDDDAIEVYQEAMPGYEIIGAMSSGWLNTDALHCRTKGMADKEMLFIEHVPISGTVPVDQDYVINTTIIPYSGQALYTDSLFIRYKVNNGDFSTLALSLVQGNDYQALIPAQANGDTVRYYIHAADESGHSANHPFIGQPDPHLFIAGTFTGIAENDPLDISVEKIYPNPFSNTLTVQYEIDKPGNINFVLTNSMGQIICNDIYENISSGKNIIQISGSDLKPGIYIYYLSNENKTVRGKVMKAN
jgi:agmatine/peptidylarginine deiminase